MHSELPALSNLSQHDCTWGGSLGLGSEPLRAGLAEGSACRRPPSRSSGWYSSGSTCAHSIVRHVEASCATSSGGDWVQLQLSGLQVCLERQPAPVNRASACMPVGSAWLKTSAQGAA